MAGDLSRFSREIGQPSGEVFTGRRFGPNLPGDFSEILSMRGGSCDSTAADSAKSPNVPDRYHLRCIELGVKDLVALFSTLTSFGSFTVTSAFFLFMHFYPPFLELNGRRTSKLQLSCSTRPVDSCTLTLCFLSHFQSEVYLHEFYTSVYHNLTGLLSCKINKSCKLTLNYGKEGNNKFQY